jgi:hypothetical protein
MIAKCDVLVCFDGLMLLTRHGFGGCLFYSAPSQRPRRQGVYGSAEDAFVSVEWCLLEIDIGQKGGNQPFFVEKAIERKPTKEEI